MWNWISAHGLSEPIQIAAAVVAVIVVLAIVAFVLVAASLLRHHRRLNAGQADLGERTATIRRDIDRGALPTGNRFKL